MAESLVIGIDAGGTRTTAWIASETDTGDSRPLGIGQAGPGNFRAVGFASATAAIRLAISEAFLAAELAPRQVSALCIGAAGAGRTDEQQRLQQWADAEGLANQTCVTNDAETVLAAANPNLVGITLISGTGSLAWGRNAAGIQHRTGGWGYLLGDEGSAYAIAIAGLKAATKAADGRGPQTTLQPAIQERLSVNAANQLIAKLYDASMTRDAIARLANCIFDCANGGDSVADGIIDAAASDLAIMANTVAGQLNLKTAIFPIALTGGVILNQHDFRRRVLADLDILNATIHLIPEPVQGAVRMAQKLVRGVFP